MISVLRPYWKSLQFLNDNDDSIELVDYLSKWDETFRRNVPYYTRPEKHELTGFYPLFSDEENLALDKEIEDLIQTTSLLVPARRTGFLLLIFYQNFIFKYIFKTPLFHLKLLQLDKSSKALILMQQTWRSASRLTHIQLEAILRLTKTYLLFSRVLLRQM